jgi:hypothetical protein
MLPKKVQKSQWKEWLTPQEQKKPQWGNAIWNESESSVEGGEAIVCTGRRREREACRKLCNHEKWITQNSPLQKLTLFLVNLIQKGIHEMDIL